MIHTGQISGKPSPVNGKMGKKSAWCGEEFWMKTEFMLESGGEKQGRRTAIRRNAQERISGGMKVIGIPIEIPPKKPSFAEALEGVLPSVFIVKIFGLKLLIL